MELSEKTVKKNYVFHRSPSLLSISAVRSTSA